MQSKTVIIPQFKPWINEIPNLYCGRGGAARGVTVKVGSNTSFGTPAWDWAMED